MLFIYTTIGTKKEAVSLSQKLVKAKLAACAGHWPVVTIPITASFPDYKKWVVKSTR